jgi:hypothetical protein
MNYEYCGMVFSSEIQLPFFKISVAPSMYYILKGKKIFTFSNMPFIFYDDSHYIVNFADKGYYEVSKTAIICYFNDLKFIKATICNIPMAIIMILNDLLPIHCSSVVSHTKNCVILFAGPKGTGKTTLSYYLNRYMHYDIFGDDVVSATNVEQQKILINRGTIAMKLCENLVGSDSISKESEVYEGWGKYYHFPKQYTNFETALPLHHLYVLKRGESTFRSVIPNFLVCPNILNNIVGISYLEILSEKIFDLIKKIKINRVSTLIVPNGLKNLKMELPNIAKIMESNK